MNYMIAGYFIGLISTALWLDQEFGTTVLQEARYNRPLFFLALFVLCVIWPLYWLAYALMLFVTMAERDSRSR